jgi:hypothetical protein
MPLIARRCSDGCLLPFLDDLRHSSRVLNYTCVSQRAGSGRQNAITAHQQHRNRTLSVIPARPLVRLERRGGEWRGGGVAWRRSDAAGGGAGGDVCLHYSSLGRRSSCCSGAAGRGPDALAGQRQRQADPHGAIAVQKSACPAGRRKGRSRLCLVPGCHFARFGSTAHFLMRHNPP